MNGARILILSSSHLSRNPRVVKEATELGRAGYTVTVLTVSSHPRFAAMDLELMRDRPFQRITLDYAGDTFASQSAGFFQRGATWIARQLCQRFGLETAQTLGPAAALLRRARAFPADLTIVHTEIPLWAAQHLMADGRRVAVDVEDWYSQDLLFADRKSRPLALLRHAEAFALRNAVYSSATSQAMGAALAQTFSCPPPLVIRNVFPLQKHSRADEPGPNAIPRFIWFSQTIGPGRGLELFFAAWTRMKQPSKVYLLGDERPGYREKLLSRLPAARHADVCFLPLIKADDLPARLAEFDVGLALEPEWPANKDLTISNKIFQYLNAGLAVVATDTAGQAEMMNASPACGLLVAAHETSEFAAKLDALLGDRARLRLAQQAARRAAEQEFSWEREAPRLRAAVAAALAQPTPSLP